jgi:hypothetical protein
MDTEAGGEEERPRDDEILAFHNLIRAADAEKLEFVGDKVRCRYIAYYYWNFSCSSPVAVHCSKRLLLS